MIKPKPKPSGSLKECALESDMKLPHATFWVGLLYLRGFSTYCMNTLPRRVWSVGTVLEFLAYFLLREKYVKLNIAG